MTPSAAPRIRRARLSAWGARWVAAAAGWLLYVLVVLAGSWHMERATYPSAPWATLEGTALVSAALWVPLTVGVAALVDRLPLERGRRARRLPAYVAAALAVCLARALAVVALNPWVGWYAAVPPFGTLLAVSVVRNTLPFAVLVGIAHALVFERRARVRGEQLARAELAALKSQLHPHFLFNALNAVSAYVRSDPDTAERLIARLSRLLRHAVDRAGTQVVALEEELGAVATYLDIEQVRFADRLRVEWAVEPAARAAEVPHLVLQPLVENAIRHGITPRNAAGVVAISARRAGPALCLSVRDDGVGMGGGPGAPARAPGEHAEGVGLRNTRARLEQLYGSRCRFTVSGAPGGGTEVTLELPFTRAAAAADWWPGAAAGGRS